jgi:hypothetical protein
MSRALNIDADQADVQASCEKAGITISMIERLQSGGTRVVLNNTVDAQAVAKTYSKKLLSEDATRRPIFPDRGSAGTARRSAS